MKMFKTFFAVIAASLLSFSVLAAPLTEQQQQNIENEFQQEVMVITQMQQDPEYIAIQEKLLELEPRLGVDITQDQLVKILMPYQSDHQRILELQQTMALAVMMINLADSSDYNDVMTMLKEDALIALASEIISIEMYIFPKIIEEIELVLQQ